MRHKDVLERPQSGETMMAYDMTGDVPGPRSQAGVNTMGTLKGKTAVVTGSTSGIGLAYARTFAAAGANVVLNGMGVPADIESERSGIETDFKVTRRAFARRHDQAAEIAEMIALGEKTFGSVDILVNNAGIQFVSPIEEFPIEKWDAIIADQPVVGLPRHPRRGARHEEARLGPHHQHGVGAFAGRFAVQVGLCLGQARHRRPDQDGGAGACDLQDHLQLHHPGYVWTPLVEKQIPETMKARNMTKEQVIKDVLLDAQPTKEFVTSEQVAALALFLCSDDAAQITGANLSIDGGWTAA